MGSVEQRAFYDREQPTNNTRQNKWVKQPTGSTVPLGSRFQQQAGAGHLSFRYCPTNSVFSFWAGWSKWYVFCTLKGRIKMFWVSFMLRNHPCYTGNYFFKFLYWAQEEYDSKEKQPTIWSLQLWETERLRLRCVVLEQREELRESSLLSATC